jgi:mRNA interferase RelE/StbE
MYTVELTSAARREYLKFGERIRTEDFNRLRQCLQSLAVNPHPAGERKLKSKHNLFRIRIGNYRIIYQVRDVERIVLIAHVLRRAESTYDFP